MDIYKHCLIMMMLLHNVYKITGVKTMNILERDKIALQAKKITALYKKRNEIQAELEKEKAIIAEILDQEQIDKLKAGGYIISYKETVYRMIDRERMKKEIPDIIAGYIKEKKYKRLLILNNPKK